MMNWMIAASLGMMTLAGSAFASVGTMEGKTYYASADCGVAIAWPQAATAQPAIKDCAITLAIGTDGSLTYSSTAESTVYTGFAQDVTASDGSTVTGLFFADLNGAYLPVNVAADGSSLADLNGVLTLSTTPPLASQLLNKTYASQVDCGIADSWYLNDGQVHYPTGTVCNVTL